jgi:hypothetical protein
MLSGKFFLTAFLIALAISFIQWFFTGFLFHRYQGQTPQTWKKENARSYLSSMIISLVFSLMFVLIFSWWQNKTGPLNLWQGIQFGAVLWFAFSLTMEVGNAIYVNYSNGFVLGKCLSGLVEYTAAGLLAAALL